MDDLAVFKATYFEECAELLTEMEEQFAAIGEGERDPGRINAAFRAVHSIKGGAGAFGFGQLVGFAHAFETLMDDVRAERVAISAEVAALCIRSVDIVADLVNAARVGEALPASHGGAEKVRFEALSAGAGGDLDETMEDFDIEFTPIKVTLKHAQTDEPNLDSFELSPLSGDDAAWEIRFAPHPALFARANDPLLLLRELERLGRTEVRAVLREIPALADFDPFGAYCLWEITLAAAGVSEEQIREVFEFVEGDCDLDIALMAAERGLRAAAAVRPAPGLDILDIAAEGPSLAELAAAIPTHIAAAVAPVETMPANDDPAVKATAVKSIRVDLDKVDRVVNMVGELVIIQSMLTQQMDEGLRARYQEMVRGLEVLAQTTRGLQDSVMAIRAQPVKSVFTRMPRLVRELAARTGKAIRLETRGEMTEIDKTVIEQLSDPLTHMIRNSADHGIEAPEQRVALGKPETGMIRLSAEQAGGNILIVVEDDGAGINRAKVLDLARQRGLVAADAQPSEEQIDNLIFAPGFSTAEAVTDLSGRGVGMDVVLSNIKKLGGSVSVRSVTGRGTRMTLRLPLTLAVLDVMLVRVGGNPYVVPLSSIIETIQCARADFGAVPSGGRVLRVRDEYVQVIDLAETLACGSEAHEDDRFVVLCEAEGSVRVALIVDDIVGQQQVVIKSLEENFERVEGIAGGTILGDGKVALIVDVTGLRTIGQKRAA